MNAVLLMPFVVFGISLVLNVGIFEVLSCCPQMGRNLGTFESPLPSGNVSLENQDFFTLAAGRVSQSQTFFVHVLNHVWVHVVANFRFASVIVYSFVSVSFVCHQFVFCTLLLGP